MGSDLECPACGSSRIAVTTGALAGFIAHLIGTQPVFSCDCLACGLHYSSHRFTDDEIAAIYAGYRGDDYNALRERYEPGYMAQYGNLNQVRAYLPQVEAFIQPHIPPAPRILDYGGNDGANTPFRDAPGAIASTYEVGDPWPSGPFDLIVMAHVLEHLPWPRKAIASVLPLLSDTGVIYAEVPLEPPVFIWHEHVNQFSEHALRAVFHDRVLDYATMETNDGPVMMIIARPHR